MSFVYLTFDDGPLLGTDDVFDVLQSKSVPGTFFMVGSAISSTQRKDWVRSINSAGHFIGNHSFSHWHEPRNYNSPNSSPNPGRSDQEWSGDFSRNDSELSTTLGLNPPRKFDFARLPGRNSWRAGSINAVEVGSERVSTLLAGTGYHIFGWDEEWHRNGSSDPIESPNTIVTNIKAKLQNPGSTKLPNKVVLLTHDMMFRQSRGTKVQLTQLLDGISALNMNIQFRTMKTYLTD